MAKSNLMDRVAHDLAKGHTHPAKQRLHSLIAAHPNDLEDGHSTVNFFSARTGRAYPDIFVKDGETIELVGRYKVAVNDSNAHVAAVLAGLGISQAAKFQAAPYLASGDLVRLLPEWSCPAVPIHVVYPPNRHLSAKVRAFVDWAAELFAKHPDL